MRFAYDLCGAEPIIKDCPVYDAAGLSRGALLMLGASAVNTADGSVCLINAYDATSANGAVDAAGILEEDSYDAGKGQDATPNQCWVHTTPANFTSGVYMGKVIINPFAVYRAEYSQLGAYDIAVESGSTTTKIAETITSDWSGGGLYVYFTHTSGSTSANRGCLRFVRFSDASVNTFTIDALPSTPATTDQYVIIWGPHKYAPRLTNDGTALNSIEDLDNVDTGTGTNTRIVSSWVEAEGLGYLELVGYKNRDTNLVMGKIDNLPSTTKLYSDIVCKDHMFGAQE